jgi:hypothetical protein
MQQTLTRSFGFITPKILLDFWAFQSFDFERT